MKKKVQANKPISVAALITDREGKVLLVKPHDKDGWLLPGGIVERGEKPSQACAREVLAEIGLSIGRPKRLLSVDYRRPPGEYIMFIFDCGVLDETQIDAIAIPDGRLLEYRFVPPEEAVKMLRPNSARRLSPTLEVRASSCIAYLEQEEVF